MYDIGFLGGGQLARMSIMAAQRMGLDCVSLDPGGDTPASRIAPARTGSLSDPEAIAAIWRESRRLTLENEFIPADAIREAARIAQRDLADIVPGVETLAVIQDKFRQRQAYAAYGAPTPRAVAIEGNAEVAVREIGFPMVLKARFGGYDGKGTRYAHTPAELESYRDLWESGGWMAEEFAPFLRELAVMVSVQGDQVTAYPVMVTEQRNHVCDLVYPGGPDSAVEVAIAAVRAVNGQGLFGVELFELPGGQVLINEIAPRPHNTGHYTQDWGGTSQFEQIVRICADIPQDPEPQGLSVVCMANVLGIERAGDPRNALRAMSAGHPIARLHWYGKAESRPGRKMGHINVAMPMGTPVESVREAAIAARTAFLAGWAGTG